MVMALRPNRGGFSRPFGAGWFIREYLLGNGPEGSTAIDPKRGAPQADINYEYKEALARATARERAEKIISRFLGRACRIRCIHREEANHLVEAALKMGAQITDVEEK